MPVALALKRLNRKEGVLGTSLGSRKDLISNTNKCTSNSNNGVGKVAQWVTLFAV